MLKIAIIGVESTGKTSLAKQLSNYYDTVFLPEYAREYVENLNRPYAYQDVLNIANKQIILEKEYEKKANNVLILDTELIITKVWFTEVFKKMPDFLEKKIIEHQADLYLLLDCDLEWQFDKVREYPELEKRQYLQNIYKKELEHYDFPFVKIHGRGEERFQKALNAIEDLKKSI